MLIDVIVLQLEEKRRVNLCPSVFAHFVSVDGSVSASIVCSMD